MPVIRTEKQNSRTLEAFYNDLASRSEAWEITRDNMLKLIDGINKEFPDRVFYALTSHARLVILDNEETSSDSLIIFSSVFPDEYFLDAMLPDGKAIWENARITTTVIGVDNAIAHFKKALINLEKL